MAKISVVHEETDIKSLDTNTEEGRSKAIKLFKTRIEGWYIAVAKELIKTHDYGFGVLILDCVLIDVLSQYYYGKNNSNQSAFKDFLKANIKEFKRKLHVALQHPLKADQQLKDYADVFYSGFRCGVLHNAKIDFGEIESKKHYFLRYYQNKERLHVDQDILLERLENYFDKYIDLLTKNKPRNKKEKDIISNFWNRFKRDFS